MHLPNVRKKGILLQRYKRFLADVKLENGKEMTVHCPNSGSMKGCSEPGSPVIISHADNPKRKYAWTLELVQHKGIWIGVNTSMTNRLVHEAIENGTINDFGAVTGIRREVKVSAASRLDFCLETEAGTVYLEVKNCSLAAAGVALFPDAVTSRGRRHLEELALLRRRGARAAVLFCVQREDADRFAPAAAIDPRYAETLQAVHARGVMVLAYRASVSPEQVILETPLPCHL